MTRHVLASLLLAVLALSAHAAEAGEAFVPPSPEAGGRTLYVDSLEGDYKGDGSAEFPWKTLDQVEQARLLPGDFIHVRGRHEPHGGFHLNKVHGEKGAWIRIVAEEGAAIVAAGMWNAVEFVKCSYVSLEGFEITSTDRRKPVEDWRPLDGVKFKDGVSRDIAILGCHIHGLGGVGVISMAPLVERIRIERCAIETCFTGIYMGYFESHEKFIADDNIIRGNLIRLCPPVDVDGRGYGVQIKGGCAGNLIEDNVIADCAGWERAAVAVYHATSLARERAAPNVIRRNLILRSRHEGIYAAEGAVIENNMIVDSGEAGIEVGPRKTGEWGTYYGDLVIRHNTIIRIKHPNGRALRLVDGAWTGKFIVAGNVLVADGRDQLSLRTPARFTGRVVANACSGDVQGIDEGTRPLDLTLFKSLTFGEEGFGVPVGLRAADRKLAPADDLEGRPRDRFPLPGCLEGPSSWKPLEHWKPLVD